MIVIADSSFSRDIKKIPQQYINELKALVRDFIKKIEDENKALTEIEEVTKLVGHKNKYRLWLPYNFRVGIYIDGDTIFLSRILPRKEIYRKFP